MPICLLYTILYMYLAIDVGGTKTLMAVFSETGELIKTHKMPTNHSYDKFLDDIKQTLTTEFSEYRIAKCCCAVPGRIDRKNGVGIRFGNLPWKDAYIVNDLRLLLNDAPVMLENDAKLGGLSEAILLQNEYKKVLYITIGTGVGGAVVVSGRLDPAFLDFEPGRTILEHDGQLKKWEELASGHALKEKYGQLASEIDDQNVWHEFAYNVALGLGQLLTILNPEVVIIGGGVGAHLDKFKAALIDELRKFENDMEGGMPPILQAKRSEEAVIYGCYELIKQHG
jgi:predicted NBD/HSP70 family sugar kinase